MPKLKTILVLIALILASWPIYRPILDYGFFPVHDDLQIQRIYEMANAIRDGQFPVRIVKDLGYGYHYPLFNFYAPLPYYVGAFFNLIGFSYLFAGKAMYFIPNFLSVLFMFIFVKKLAKNNWLAFLAGILYAYFPYRAADNYVRGVTGELFVMMFLPILLLGIYEMFTATKNFKFQISNFKFIIALSGIILSHNIYAYLVCLGLAFFSATYIIVGLIKKDKSYLPHMSSLIINSLISLFLTAFFWLPAFTENKFTHLEKISQAGYYFGNFFIPLKELWQSDWGYGGAAGGMSFMVGKIHIIMFIITFSIYLYMMIKQKKIKLLPIFFIFLVAVCTFLTNQKSFILWKMIPMLNLTQYPMRFIFFIDFSLILFIIFSLTDIIQKINQKIFFLTVIFFAGLVIFRNVGFYRSAYNYDFKPFYLSQKYLEWDTTIRGDEYLPKEFVIPIKEDEISDGSVKTNLPVDIKIISHTSTEMKVEFHNIQNNLILKFPITNFPGWKMYVNEKEKTIIPQTKYNLIAGVFEKGKYVVDIKFENTLIRIIGNLISLISLIGLISFIVKKTYGRKKS